MSATDATQHYGATTLASDEWIPGWQALHFAGQKRDGRWFVIIEEFDIAGVGDTIEDARAEALALLNAYLQAHRDDGTRFEETLRPIPRRMKIEIRLGTALHRVLGGDHAERALSEERVLVPRSAIDGPAVPC